MEEIESLFKKYLKKDLLLLVKISDIEDIEEGYLDVNREFLWEDFLYECWQTFDQDLAQDLDFAQRYHLHQDFAKTIEELPPVPTFLEFDEYLYDNYKEQYKRHFPEYFEEEND